MRPEHSGESAEIFGDDDAGPFGFGEDARSLGVYESGFEDVQGECGERKHGRSGDDSLGTATGGGDRCPSATGLTLLVVVGKWRLVHPLQGMSQTFKQEAKGADRYEADGWTGRP